LIDSLIPRPNVVTPSGEAFLLGPSTVITHDEVSDSPDDQGTGSVAIALQQQLRSATGLPLDVRRSDAQPADAIHLRVDAALPGSAYRLVSTSNGVQVVGGSPAGVFHGTQTLLQLLPPDILRRAVVHDVEWAVPGVEISDSPRFSWRGLLLDTSRHFFGKESVLKLVDVLALHRMNVLHLHLTDDQGWRIEIHRYPRLTAVGSWRRRSAIGRHSELGEEDEMAYDESPHGGFYSQEDLREIVAYAAARFITVVPEIDLPGHSQAAIAAYPELGNTDEPLEVWTRWGINPHVLNVEDSTITFFKHVLDEVLEIFPSTFIHIGGDECPKDEWRASERAQAKMRALGLASEDELQSWVIRQMADYLSDRGRRLVGWDEIREGGLPAGATVMSWRGESGGILAAEAGHDVVLTPESHTYFYRHQSEDRSREPAGAPPVLDLATVYSYDPMPAGLSDEARRRVLGTQCQMWTEFVSTPRQMEQKLFPRLSAFAESAWCSDRDSFEAFASRLEGHVDRLRALGLDVFDPDADGSVRQE
jgi:hexosaminidase